MFIFSFVVAHKITNIANYIAVIFISGNVNTALAWGCSIKARVDKKKCQLFAENKDKKVELIKEKKTCSSTPSKYIINCFDGRHHAVSV